LPEISAERNGLQRISVIFHSVSYSFLREEEVVHTYQPAAQLPNQGKAERRRSETDFRCILLVLPQELEQGV